ncbi:hypothetical protein [Candidatus Ichthyocystis hellenicum]|uniref:hypothetical protein n=1 Tax=Candidatus Ichthyocystis hellenicum TaxID=1561003 RepID=UPI000B89F5D5|nr:hypothetical protein [Candidatus Ichthyocystis hellenicum]
MSDRITLGVYDSSSGGSEDGETTGAGRDGSPLGAAAQDEGEDSKSGCGSGPGRGSLASPGRGEPLKLGARPKERSAKGVGKDGERKGKFSEEGNVWHKRDRRSAKHHRGRGQELAAERTAKLTAGAKGRGRSKGGADMSGLIAVRHVATEARSGHGRVGKRTTFLANMRDDFRRYGVGGSLFIIFFFLAFMLGPAIALVIFALDNIAKSANSDREGKSGNGSLKRLLGYIVLVGSLAYLLIVVKIMTNIPNLRLGEKDKSKKK